MPFISFNIDEYSVQYNSNSPPQIILKSLSGGDWGGKLIFKPNGEILPAPAANTASPPPRYITLYYHLDDFQNVIDVLRNEKPVWIFLQYYSFPGTTSAGITTREEPVGEGEQ